MKADDELLDHADSFANRLRYGLDHIAQAEPVSDPGRFDPDVMQIGRRSDTRSGHWFVGAAAAAVVVLGVGGLVVLDRDDPAPSAPADQPVVEEPGGDTSVPDGSAVPAASAPADARFNGASLFTTPLAADQVPVVVMDGATTTYAHSQRYPGPFGSGFAGATVLVPVDASFDTPRIAIDVVERSGANGNQTLDLADSGEPIEVAGTTGYLATEATDLETGEDGPLHLLFFDVDPNHYVLFNASGVGVDELVSIANAYDPATGTVDTPDGLRELPMPDHDINRTVEFVYEVSGMKVELHGSSRGAEFLLGMIASSVTSTQVIDGVEAIVRSEADNRWSVFWIGGDWSFRANFSNIDDPAVIPELLTRFHLVDDATFAATYAGDDVVTDSTRAHEVEAMLADVDLPPALNVSDLTDRRGTNVRYQEIAAVSGAIVCSWLDVYYDNVDTDPGAAQAAADALAASTEWDMLQEIDNQGGWSSVVWETAGAITGDGLIATGVGGQPPTRENTYSGLGCDTR
jgi:hypothetical protein